MAKKIKYSLCAKVNNGTEEKPIWEEVLTPVEMDWNESNEAIAAAEAYNGEYTIEDDGMEEAVVPTTEERLEAIESAMLDMVGVLFGG